MPPIFTEASKIKDTIKDGVGLDIESKSLATGDMCWGPLDLRQGRAMM